METQVRLSEMWLFGTRRMLASREYAECLEIAMHTHPNGQYTDEPFMSEEEAAELLQTEEFPDSVWNRR